MNCRYCDQPIVGQAVDTFSYWGGLKCVCHPECKEQGVKDEARDCQIIDADCNDCKHFKRGSIVKHPPHIQATIDAGDCPNFTTGIWTGHCLKFDRSTRAYPKKWTGMPCFEHRRAA